MTTRMATMGCVLITMLALPTSAVADSNAARDFSPALNPDGDWSYGWSQQLGSQFFIDTLAGKVDGLDYWAGAVAEPSPPGHFPLVAHNGTSSAIVSSNTVLVQPGQLLLHPGPGGEYAVLRFTADAAGAYSISTRFAGLDFVGPTTTDVHVLVGGQSVFDSVVNAFAVGPSFQTVVSLPLGGTIDFVVGFGNGDFHFDSTAVDAVLSPVPESSVVALYSAGLLIMASYALRRPRRCAGRVNSRPIAV